MSHQNCRPDMCADPADLHNCTKGEVSALCTCHAPARPMKVYDPSDPNSEWAHVDDETYAEVFHVHEHSSSRDCDGPHESSTTLQIPSLIWHDHELSYKSSHCSTCSQPIPPTPDAHDLWNKLCRLAVPFHREGVLVNVSGNDDGTLTLTWGGQTDEGFDSGALIGCKDPYCTHDDDTNRDVFAERMNY